MEGSVELADAFLADFEDDFASEEEINPEHEKEEVEKEVEELKDLNIENTTRLLRDDRLLNHMKQVEKLMTKTTEISRDEEYPLIVASNEFSFQIDNDVVRLNRLLRDLYSTRFPELEQLVPNAMEFAKVVNLIGNQTEISKVSFEGIIPPHTIMVIKITATNSAGTLLNASQLEKVNSACSATFTLEEYKRKLYEYVASRMTSIAPNICVLIGADLAARILALAGGLIPLSRMPAGNIQLLGQSKKSGAEFTRQNHAGLIYSCEIVRKTPTEFRNKAGRYVASKLALLARVDAYHEIADSSLGESYRNEILKKLDKIQEPPPLKAMKALPVPQETRKKRRGGQRHRKLKERFEVTDLAKLKNRVKFGEAQQEDETMGVEYGLLGNNDNGKIRVQAKDTQKLSKFAALKQSRKTKKSVVNGMATSLILTASTGVELVDPNAIKEKMKDGTATYFSNNIGFSKRI